MVQLIIAIDKNNGIGYGGKLPWNDKEELKLFQEKTKDSYLVMGEKTVLTLPKLKDRKIVCMTKDPNRVQYNKNNYKNDVNEMILCDNIDELCENGKKIFIAGGAQIYRLALEKPGFVTKIHMSIMNDIYDCDTVFDPKLIRNFVAVSREHYDTFDHFVLEPKVGGERQYLDLLINIRDNGEFRDTRNGVTKALFCENMKFDLREGFPLLTTKKMFLRGVVEELLFFLRGDTDSSILEEKKVNIWKENTSKEFLKNKKLDYAPGVMGPLYGFQWRNFNSVYKLDKNKRPIEAKGGVDQLSNVVNLIKNDPHSRRILLTAYNPAQAEEGVLYPCHSIAIQFYVSGKHLDMFCFCRSQDEVLGTPFNIASSSLLLMIIAELTGKIPRYFYMGMGDVHVYSEHMDSVNKQVKRIPFKFPTIDIPKIENLTDIHFLKASQFTLHNYLCHPAIKVQMVA